MVFEGNLEGIRYDSKLSLRKGNHLMKKKLAWRILLLLFLGTFFYFFFELGGARYLSFAYAQSQLNFVRELFEKDPYLVSGVYFLIYVAVAALSLPGAAVMTLFGGAVFGLTWGVVLVSFASTIGATLAFLMARFLLYDFVKAKFRDRYDRIQEGFNKNGGFFVFSIRLVPLIPFFVANLLFGLTPVRVGSFYLFSQLGMLPGTIVYVNAGKQLGELDHLSGVLTPSLLISFLVLAAFPWISKTLLGWLRARKQYSKFKRPKEYDFQTVVIGGGSAGLVASSLTAALKGRVALIEKHKMGGDCLNTGCVPSKALIRSAKWAHHMNRAEDFGFKNAQFEVDFPKMMERIHSVIKKIEPHDSIERYESLGVRCFKGSATIRSPFEVEVNGEIFRTKNIIVATGARPRRIPFPGVEEVPVLDSDNLWGLKELPKRLLVLGGGPIGCELAQSFSRLGSEVTIMEAGAGILSKEDEDVSLLMTEIFKKEGLRLLVETKAKSFKKSGPNFVCVAESKGHEIEVSFDYVLMALGRVANVRGFGLEELGVEINKEGTISCNEYLQTSLSNIYACGDVAGPYQFTHMAGQQGSIAALNAYASPFKKFKWDTQKVPWVTYTDPEVAHTGMSELQVLEKGVEFETYKFNLESSDRALAEGSSAGFVKVFTEKGSDKILGVTIVGEHAGEMLSEFSVTMKAGKGLNHILSVIHSYPTLTEANKSVALAWKKKQTPEWVMNFLEKWNAWRL